LFRAVRRLQHIELLLSLGRAYSGALWSNKGLSTKFATGKHKLVIQLAHSNQGTWQSEHFIRLSGQVAPMLYSIWQALTTSICVRRLHFHAEYLHRFDVSWMQKRSYAGWLLLEATGYSKCRNCSMTIQGHNPYYMPLWYYKSTITTTVGLIFKTL
jgi:hypothetical protein